MRMARCKGRKADGERCRSPFVEKNGYCVSHGPDGARRMRERGRAGAAATIRRNGGAGLSPDQLGRLETIADAQRWLRTIAQAVGERNLTHNEGSSMTRAVEGWIRAEGERLKADEFAALQAQVEELKHRGLRAS